MAKRTKRTLNPRVGTEINDAAADAAMATLAPRYREDLRFDFFRSQVRSAVVRYSGKVGDRTLVDAEIDGLHDQVATLDKARRLVEGEIHQVQSVKEDSSELQVTRLTLLGLAEGAKAKIDRLEKFRGIVVKNKGSDPARDAMSFELLKVYAMIVGRPADEVRIDKNHIRSGSSCDFIGAALEAVFGERDSPANIWTSVERGRASAGKN